jgi:uncharacterized protein YqgC (DUF456 family)
MDPWLQIGGMTAVIVLFIIGLIGVIVPLLPGILLIWGAVLFYAAAVDGFTVISPWLFALITIIAIAAGTADWWLLLLGAKTIGASFSALLLGVVGAIIGTFLIPVPLLGTLAGYALGILLGEYLRLRDWRAALRAAGGGLAGWGIGTALQLVGALVIIGLFVWAVS